MYSLYIKNIAPTAAALQQSLLLRKLVIFTFRFMLGGICQFKIKLTFVILHIYFYINKKKALLDQTFVLISYDRIFTQDNSHAHSIDKIDKAASATSWRMSSIPLF